MADTRFGRLPQTPVLTEAQIEALEMAVSRTIPGTTPRKTTERAPMSQTLEYKAKKDLSNVTPSAVLDKAKTPRVEADRRKILAVSNADENDLTLVDPVDDVSPQAILDLAQDPRDAADRGKYLTVDLGDEDELTLGELPEATTGQRGIVELADAADGTADTERAVTPALLETVAQSKADDAQTAAVASGAAAAAAAQAAAIAASTVTDDKVLDTAATVRTQADRGKVLAVSATDENDVVLADAGDALTDAAVLNLAKTPRTQADRGRLLAASAADENQLALIDAPAGGGGGGAVSPGFLVTRSPAAAVTTDTAANQAWGPWVDIVTLPAVTAQQAGFLEVFAVGHGVVSAAPGAAALSGGGDRCMTEVRVQRTRGADTTDLLDQNIYGPRNVANAPAAFASSTIIEDFDLVVPDEAEAGDIYKFSIRVKGQSANLRRLTWATVGTALMIYRAAGAQGPEGPAGPPGSGGTGFRIDLLATSATLNTAARTGAQAQSGPWVVDASAPADVRPTRAFTHGGVPHIELPAAGADDVAGLVLTAKRGGAVVGRVGVFQWGYPFDDVAAGALSRAHGIYRVPTGPGTTVGIVVQPAPNPNGDRTIYGIVGDGTTTPAGTTIELAAARAVGAAPAQADSSVTARGQRVAVSTTLPTAAVARDTIIGRRTGAGTVPDPYTRSFTWNIPAELRGQQADGRYASATRDSSHVGPMLLFPPTNPRTHNVTGLTFVSMVAGVPVHTVSIPYGGVPLTAEGTARDSDYSDASLFFRGGAFSDFSTDNARIIVRWVITDDGYPEIRLYGDGTVLPDDSTIEVYERGVFGVIRGNRELVPLTALPPNDGYPDHSIVNFAGDLYENVPHAMEGNVLRARSTAVVGSYIGTGSGYGAWQDPDITAEFDTATSVDAVIPKARWRLPITGTAPPHVYAFDMEASGQDQLFEGVRESARDAVINGVQLRAYVTEIGGPAVFSPGGKGRAISFWHDEARTNPLKVHTENRWEREDRDLVVRLSDDIPADTLPRPAGSSTTAASQEALFDAIDQRAAAAGAPAWGAGADYTRVAGAPSVQGQIRQLASRYADLWPRSGARDDLLAATAIQIGPHRVGVRVSPEGTAVAQHRDANGTSDHDAVTGIAAPNAQGLATVSTANLATHTDLAANSIVRFSGVTRPGGAAVASNDYYRVQSVDRAANTFTIYTEETLTAGGSAFWSRIVASTGRDTLRPSVITAAQRMVAANGMAFWRFSTADPPEVGGLVALTNATGRTTGVWPVFARTGLTFDIRDPAAAITLDVPHAERLELAFAHPASLPAVGSTIRIATNDEIITRRGVQAIADGAAAGAVGDFPRYPRLLTLFRAAASAVAAGTPSGGFGGGMWSGSIGDPWETNPGDVVVPGGQHLYQAVTEYVPTAFGWTGGPWKVYLADGATVQWAESSTGPWHAARTAQDGWTRHQDIATGLWGGAIPVGGSGPDGWTQLCHVQNYQPGNVNSGGPAVPWSFQFTTPWAVGGADFIVIDLTLQNASSADVGRYTHVMRPRMIVAPFANRSVIRWSAHEMFSLEMGDAATRFAVKDLALPSQSATSTTDFGIVAKFRAADGGPTTRAGFLDIHFMKYINQRFHLWVNAIG